MLKKVLVANRGEIAVRVIRTCARMGIATVAVYSDADRDALHVRCADEALRVGPARATASYLDVAAVVAAARSAGADGIHPGYGFLSENPALPEACEAADITFVGPPPAAMRLLGDKSAARRLATEHGVPVLPGCEATSDDRVLVEAAAAIGFPLMVKAAAGGGGRGMRLVSSNDALPAALAGARREAEAAFGDGRLLIERAVIGGRHIEVQFLADAHGHAVHLGERDCSVQRRHQKVIEESPAPGIDDALRQGLCRAALTVAGAAGYVNAGTAEFLVDHDGRFYFLEVNTRLQVEHPVTEMVTGLDLVELQLRIAAGEPLPLRQADVRVTGHAIECRVYAEDPERGYLPSSGRVTYFLPPVGDEVRVDSGVESGSAVPSEYDPLLAKVVVHAPSRADAVRRCARALESSAVEGVNTNLGLLQAVVTHPAFVAGTFELGLLESMSAATFAARLPHEVLLAAAASDLGPFAAARGGDPWQALGAWRAGGGVRLEYLYHGRSFAVNAARLAGRPDAWSIMLDGESHEIEVAHGLAGDIIVKEGQSEAAWGIQREARRLVLGADGRRFVLARPQPSRAGVLRTSAAGTGELRAPMPAVVVRVLVAPGDRVAAHQQLVVLEAMKIEHIIGASVDGVVEHVRCVVGQRVAEGEILVEMSSGLPSGDVAS